VISKSNLVSYYEGISTGSQKKIDTFSASVTCRCTSLRSQQLTSKLADMVAQDMLPLSFVDGTGFRQLMNLVEPEYHVHGRS